MGNKKVDTYLYLGHNVKHHTYITLGGYRIYVKLIITHKEKKGKHLSLKDH